MDPGDPEASAGAQDGAGGRSAQTAEKGERLLGAPVWQLFHCMFKSFNHTVGHFIHFVERRNDSVLFTVYSFVIFLL